MQVIRAEWRYHLYNHLCVLASTIVCEVVSMCEHAHIYSRAYVCVCVVLFKCIMVCKRKQLFPCILYCLALQSFGEITQRSLKCWKGKLCYLLLSSFTVVGSGLLLFYSMNLFYMHKTKQNMASVLTFCFIHCVDIQFLKYSFSVYFSMLIIIHVITYNTSDKDVYT